MLFVDRELGTDSFETNVNRIFLVKCDDPFKHGEKMFICRAGAVEYMKKNYPQVKDFCRISKTKVQFADADGTLFYDSPTLYKTSSNFFSFFNFRLLTKTPDPILATRKDIVISRDLAMRYFGNLTPIGKTLKLRIDDQKSEFVVKGVFRKPDSNSLLNCDMVTLDNESEYYAFILLDKGADPGTLEKTFSQDKDKIPNINAGISGRYYLENLKQAYFDTTQKNPLGPVREKSRIWIALSIGILIMCIAVFNYLNLLSSNVIDKMHEFYIRRVTGASKQKILMVFMIEHSFVVAFAVILSIVLLPLAIPFFNTILKSDISFGLFGGRDYLLFEAGVIILLLLITFLFSDSKIQIQTSLAPGKVLSTYRNKVIQFPALRIFQLTVTLVLLICSLIIIKQIKYTKSRDIGLERQVMELVLPDEYSEKGLILKEEILKSPSVEQVSISDASPLRQHWSTQLHYSKDGQDKEYVTSLFYGDENYISTLGIKLLTGRNFTGNAHADKHNCLINESLQKLLDDPDLIGKKLPGDDSMVIIGIVKDFNYSGLTNLIEPCEIKFSNTGSHILIKASPGANKMLMKRIEETWGKIIPDYPYRLETVGELFELFHREDENYARLIGSCCIISFFLSMIGLFAISYITVKKCTKTIGIYKIIGATVLEVLHIINKDLLGWILISFIIAAPVAGYFMQKWLENFAYRTALSWWVFVLAGLIALIIVLLTVSWHSFRAATRNPVEALRYE